MEKLTDASIKYFLPGYKINFIGFNFILKKFLFFA